MEYSDERYRGIGTEGIKELNPLCLGKQKDVALVAKVSGEFYTDIYQPIEYETYRHESYQSHYKRHTVIVICFVLLLLGLMLFVTFPKIKLQMLTVFVIVMLFSSLLMLAIDADKQIKLWHKWKRMLKNLRRFIIME